uniref:Uncharacterized protein n=1 Tax=Podoviridae sp. ctngc57 TaxID=2825275 RepID=A0A8S5U7A7_9CAUD|nr:MAG TPA: hypothetical protein [Podoviridae sp. ctngc57]
MAAPSFSLHLAAHHALTDGRLLIAECLPLLHLAQAQHLRHGGRHLHLFAAADQVALAVHGHELLHIVLVDDGQHHLHPLGLLRLGGLGRLRLGGLGRLRLGGVRRLCDVQVVIVHVVVLSSCGGGDHPPPRRLSVGLGGSAPLLGHALDTHHVLLQQDLGGADALPAHGGALIQRIGGAAAAAWLHNGLQAAAGDLGHAVGVLAQHQRGEHAVVGGGYAAAAGGGFLGAGAVVPDLRLRGLHEAHARDLAQLAVEQLRGGGVLVGVDPAAVLPQVKGHIGVDDGHVLAVEAGHVLGLQGGRRLFDHLHRQLSGGVHAAAGFHRRLRAGGDLGAPQHVGARHQLVAHHGIHGQTRLAAQQLGGLHDHVVDGGQIQQVGDADEVAVLAHGGRQAGHVQRAAVGGHALGQGGHRLRQLVELSELNGLAVAPGNVPLLAELLVHQLGARLAQQHLVIKGFHLRRQVVAGGAGGGGVGHVSKQLQIQHHHPEMFGLIHAVSFPEGLKADLLAPPRSADDLIHVLVGELRHVALHGHACARPVLGGALGLRLDLVHQLPLRLLSGVLHGLWDQLVVVQPPVGALHAGAVHQRTEERGIGQLLLQIQPRVLLGDGLCLLRPLGQVLLHLLAVLLLPELLLQLVVLPLRFADGLHLIHAHAHPLRLRLIEGVVLLDGGGQRLDVGSVHAVALGQHLQHRLHSVERLHVGRGGFQPSGHRVLYPLGVHVLEFALDELFKLLAKIPCRFFLLLRPGVGCRLFGLLAVHDPGEVALVSRRARSVCCCAAVSLCEQLEIEPTEQMFHTVSSCP